MGAEEPDERRGLDATLSGGGGGRGGCVDGGAGCEREEHRRICSQGPSQHPQGSLTPDPRLQGLTGLLGLSL